MSPVVSALVLSLATDPVPDSNDVKAGWGALVLVVALVLVCVFLFRSFSKQLRKAQAAKDAGVFDDPAPGRGASGEPQTHQRP